MSFEKPQRNYDQYHGKTMRSHYSQPSIQSLQYNNSINDNLWTSNNIDTDIDSMYNLDKSNNTILNKQYLWENVKDDLENQCINKKIHYNRKKRNFTTSYDIPSDKFENNEGTILNISNYKTKGYHSMTNNETHYLIYKNVNKYLEIELKKQQTLTEISIWNLYDTNRSYTIQFQDLKTGRWILLETFKNSEFVNGCFRGKASKTSVEITSPNAKLSFNGQFCKFPVIIQAKKLRIFPKRGKNQTNMLDIGIALCYIDHKQHTAKYIIEEQSKEQLQHDVNYHTAYHNKTFSKHKYTTKELLDIYNEDIFAENNYEYEDDDDVYSEMLDDDSEYYEEYDYDNEVIVNDDDIEKIEEETRGIQYDEMIII